LPINYLWSPALALERAKTIISRGCLFYLIFSITGFLDVAQPRFSKLCYMHGVVLTAMEALLYGFR